MKLINKLWTRLPETSLKQKVRSLLRSDGPGQLPRSAVALAAEIAKLKIREAGVEHDGHPYIKLASDLMFHGLPAAESTSGLYAALAPETRSRLPEACYPVAEDIICRYVYPHADVDATPPYPIEAREAPFHPQHRDTISDLTGFPPAQITALRERFAIKPGDVVIDAGAYIGFGALSISRRVGGGGRVISFEAMPVNQEVFLRNMKANRATNVSLVRAACWNVRGSMELQCTTQQANSLVDGIVDSRNTVTVPTENIDNVVADHHLDRVDLVSLTINGAETEGLLGMEKTLDRFSPLLTIAGWYERNGVPVHKPVTEILHRHGYETIVGPVGRVYAWKSS